MAVSNSSMVGTRQPLSSWLQGLSETHLNGGCSAFECDHRSSSAAGAFEIHFQDLAQRLRLKRLLVLQLLQLLFKFVQRCHRCVSSWTAVGCGAACARHRTGGGVNRLPIAPCVPLKLLPASARSFPRAVLAT